MQAMFLNLLKMNKIIKYVLATAFLTCFLLLNSFSLKSGEDIDVRDLSYKERIFVGGYIGLQFGSYTFIDVSPLAGYRITNRISAGIGGTYQYMNDNYWGYGSTNIFGGSLFARISIIPQLFVHGEFEMLNLESGYFTENPEKRFWEENYLLGLGYRQKISEKSSFNIMLLYNFNQDSYVYYQNPIFRFSIEVGL